MILSPPIPLIAISSTLRSFLASPPDRRIRASCSLMVIFFSFRMTSCLIAVSSNPESSSSSRDFKIYTCDRESNAEMTSKEGFSVVAPIKVTNPLSTAPNKLSCCDLLKRWISSIKRIGRPIRLSLSKAALSITSLISLTPELIALRLKKGRSSVCDMM
ncbi:hypothetical protein D3C85_1180610 [compost metagenome]